MNGAVLLNDRYFIDSVVLKNKTIFKGLRRTALDKKMGKHCSFLNAYVAIHVKYEQGEASVRSCDESSCQNSMCNLSKSFAGDRASGKDCLDQPKR